MSTVVLFVALPVVALASAGRLLAAGSEPTRRKIVEAEEPTASPPSFRSALVLFVLVLAAAVLLLRVAR